jgi:ABC-type branched-subunit amino acid transport system permease subunit
VIPGIYIGGFVASVLYGMPAKLPGVALGFPVLFDCERAGAALGVVSVVSIFAYMTSLGHLPSQFGNVIGYSAVAGQHDLEGVTAGSDGQIESRLAQLEQNERTSEGMLAVIKERLNALDSRFDVVETEPLK